MSGISQFSRPYLVLVSVAVCGTLASSTAWGQTAGNTQSYFASDTSLPLPFPQLEPPLDFRSFPNGVPRLPITPVSEILQTDLLSPNLQRTALDFNSSINALMPFAGCANTNWAAYNKAIKIAAQLRISLSEEVVAQQKALASDSSPERIAQAEKAALVVENTTTALEKATQVLVYLGKVFDKAR